MARSKEDAIYMVSQAPCFCLMRVSPVINISIPILSPALHLVLPHLRLHSSSLTSALLVPLPLRIALLALPVLALALIRIRIRIAQ